MTNRLAQETSPYLLQHRDNPVDWYPWGEEALARARAEDRPILLSVGYSACHWCHVMERESFEDPETAAYMNEHFVNVKVDREERPDVDALYMEAVQAMTGQGGWPMTVFLDPEGVPFYGGTYFPPDEGRGMPSFRMVMEAIVASFEGKREEIRERAEGVRARLGAVGEIEPDPELPTEAELEAAIEMLLASADRQRGGFRGAPKFPPASALELLMTRGGPGSDALAVVERTLDAMLAGGIYDQLGGGFARYSVDAVWLVPHFEKMLYDNALLARAYLHGWQVLGHERYRRVCEETLDWMLREMRGPEGGFYSALDADSEGEEGRFYVWHPEEIREVLAGSQNPNGLQPQNSSTLSDQQVERLLGFWGVTEAGNFEGANILHLAEGPAAEPPEGLEGARRALYEARAQRVWPGLDDKRLTSWNALAIGALAEAGAVLGREDYLAAAQKCAEFVLDSLRDGEGRLLRTYKDGDARLNAYLEDHAFLLEALLKLYESSFEARWFAAARRLGDTLLARFGDPERGGFYSTSGDHEQLIARRKELGDHPIPAGNSAAALGLARLEALSGERAYGDGAAGVLRLFARTAVQHPESFAHLLRALDFALEPTHEVALVGEDVGGDEGVATDGVTDLAAIVRAQFRPRLVLAAGPEGSDEPPLLAGRTEVDGKPAAYVCQNFTCQLPVTDPAALQASLGESNHL
ncbi:MAG TPA: thioredoxin domain-containing protein [Solirubrobacterales bacterium]|nr:thioredoxin domain-containing protein [Solirubrobacterales bacterium]